MLSLPLARGRVVVGKLVALAIQTVVFCVVVFLASLAGRAFELTVDVGPLASTTLGVALLGLDFGLLAMAVGAATGKRGEALGSLGRRRARPSSSARWRRSSSGWSRLATCPSSTGRLATGSSRTACRSAASTLVLVAVGVVVAVVALRAFDSHDLT